MSAPPPSRSSRLWSHAHRLTIGGLCAVVLTAAGVGLALAEPTTTSAATNLAADNRTDRASRDLDRASAPSATPTSTAPTASPAPTTASPTLTSTTAGPTTSAPRQTTTRTTAKSSPKATATSVASACRRYTGYQRTACALLPRYGFGYGEMSALVPMWEHESGWDPASENASSGAYGIPQALPGSKMAAAGSDWRTNAATQIRWGLSYIKEVYGTPTQAWEFWQANYWY